MTTPSLRPLPPNDRNGERAQARAILFPAISFCLGLMASAWWFISHPQKSAVEAPRVAVSELSAERTRPAVASPSQAVVRKPVSQLAVDETALKDVRRVIPHPEKITLEVGTGLLRKAALKDLQQSMDELQSRQKKAEDRFVKGQKTGSDDLQRSATRELAQIRTEQVERVNQLAANSKAQIEAFTLFKQSTPHEVR